MRLKPFGMLQSFTLLITLGILPSIAGEKSVKGGESAVLWREPADIGSRNLFLGPGGKPHEPHGPFTFVEEDLAGTNPKYVVHDQDGIKWTVKLGAEARPETVATRLVWAVGYFVDEDYFLKDMTIGDMPAQVKRGRSMIGPGGTLHNVRLKRHVEGREKAGNRSWRDDPFSGTQELDGLRTLMAVINNWDLKDVNNKIYKEKHQSELIYVVSDLGASFGSSHLSFPLSESKGNLHNYTHSRFLTKTTGDSLNFAVPGRPSLIYAFGLRPYLRRSRLAWIGKNIPRAHAKWMGEMLARLSPEQIRDAFRAAGYSPAEVDAFAAVLQKRISQLDELVRTDASNE